MRRAWTVLAILTAFATLGAGLATANPTPAPSGAQLVGRQEFTIGTGHTDPWTGAPRRIALTAWYPTTVKGESRYLSDDLATEVLFAGKIGMLLGAPKLPMQLVGRTVPAAMNAPVAGSSLPVVLVSPGWGMPREFMSTIAMNLASRGYLTVTVSHTFDAMVSRFGTELVNQVPEQMDPAYSDKVIDTRVADLRAVIDHLPGLGMDADVTRIAALGHSYGGYAAVEAMAYEPRIKAGVALDANLGLPGTRPSVAATRGLDRPVLALGDLGTLSDTWDTYREHSTVQPVTVLTPGIAHMQFSDLCLMGGDALTAEVCGSTDPAITQQMVDARVAEFLRMIL